MKLSLILLAIIKFLFFNKQGKFVFGKLFVFIFIIIPVMFALYLLVSGQPMEAVEYIYPKLATPLYELADQLELVVERGGTFCGFFCTFGMYYNLLIPAVVIWRWLFFLKKRMDNSFLSNNSDVGRNWIWALIIFFIVQMFLGLYHPQDNEPIKIMDIFRPYEIFPKLFKAFPLLISEATHLIDEDSKDYIDGLNEKEEINNTIDCVDGCLGSHLLREG